MLPWLRRITASPGSSSHGNDTVIVPALPGSSHNDSAIVPATPSPPQNGDAAIVPAPLDSPLGGDVAIVPTPALLGGTHVGYAYVTSAVW